MGGAGSDRLVDLEGDQQVGGGATEQMRTVCSPWLSSVIAIDHWHSWGREESLVSSNTPGIFSVLSVSPRSAPASCGTPPDPAVVVPVAS